MIQHDMLRRFLFISFAVILCAGAARAQNGPIVSLEDPALWYFNPLLARGHLSDLSQASFPIREKDFLRSLENVSRAAGPMENDWVRRIRQRLHQFPESRTSIGLRMRPGILVSTQERLDMLRPQKDPQEVIYSQISFESWLRAGNWTAAWGWRHDRYYDRDPDGIDSAHRWFVRPENAYLSYDGEFASVLFGRTRQHWGGYDQPGLVLSDNPRPMDYISFRIGTPRLNLRTSVSELDSITGDGRFTGLAGDDSVSTGSERRYLAVHRFSLTSPGKWSVGLMHSILYSGANSGFSLTFANPFQLAVLSVDDKPKNEENNGMLGAFFQIQRSQTLLQGQVALDDFDLLNGKEPASISANLHMYRASVSSGLDLSAGATFVTARTYNADQPEGKYIYLNRGIATQYSDFISAYAALHWLSTDGWIVSPRLDILFQGEQDMRNPFPLHDDADLILDGVTEQIIRPSVQVSGMLSNGFDVRLNAGMNLMKNENHIEDVDGSRFVGSASIAYRINWSRDL